MKRLLVLLTLLFIPGCGLFKFSPPQVREPEEPKVDVVARAVDNTIGLVNQEGEIFCSGAVAEGVFVTAFHCVDGEKSFRVLYKGTLYQGFATYIFPEKDLAFIDAIGAKVKDTIPLSDWQPQLGQKVVWLGYPQGTELLMGTGIVASPSSEGSWAPGFLAIYGQFIPGNSGGPVFDEDGKLIGIVSSTMLVPMGFSASYVPIGYAVPWPVLRDTLNSL